MQKLAIAALALVAGYIGGWYSVTRQAPPYSYWLAYRDHDPAAIYRAERAKVFDRFHRPADAVFVGDSIMEGIDLREATGRNIANRSIKGETVEGLLERVPGILNTGGEVFILAGVNDLDNGETVEATVKRYRQLVKALGGARPLAVLPCNSMASKCASLAPKIERLNAELATIPGFIDTHATMAGPDGQLRAAYTYDGIHLTAQGYAALFGLL